MAKSKVALPFKIAAEPKKKKAAPRTRKADLKQLISHDKPSKAGPMVATYKSIAAPRSQLPKKHYCSVTGFPAPYKDSQTHMYYRNARAFTTMRHMTRAQLDAIKAISTVKLNGP